MQAVSLLHMALLAASGGEAHTASCRVVIPVSRLLQTVSISSLALGRVASTVFSADLELHVKSGK